MLAKKAVEFTVSLPNRPGALAELMAKLASRDINIDAFMLYTSFIVNIPNRPLVAGFCRVVPHDDQRAREACRDFGLNVREEEVLVLRAQNRPGVLARELQILAEAGLDVKDGYATVPIGHDDVTVVLAVSDIEKAMAALTAAA